MRDTGSRVLRRATYAARVAASAEERTRSGSLSSRAIGASITAARRRRTSAPALSTPTEASAAVHWRTAEPTVRPVRRPASPRVCSRSRMLAQRSQLARLVVGDERVDQLVERGAVQHLVKLVHGEVDAMVGHPPLRKVVGADTLRAVP